MLKLNASLEAVKTRKNVSDDIIRTIVLNVYINSSSDLAELDLMYRKPLQLILEEKS
jgi:hypothetical protein